jgi:NitT/TauT family transport system substrate-binding protein
MMRGVVFGLLSALGWLVAATGAGAEPVEFGTTGRSDSTSIATYIALENKYFEEAGLQIEWIPAGSAAKAVQQTVAGSLNISIAATDATVRAVAEGAALKIVAGTVNAAPFRVVGGPGIKTWADLKGKTVSVGGPTDQTLFFFRIMARKNGLADKDYDLIYAGTTPARFAQLMSGQVGAAVLTNPNDLVALGTGAADLGSAPDYVPVWSQNNVFVNTSWAKAHRPAVVSFLKALKRGVDVFYDPGQRDKVVAIMSKYTGSEPAISEKIYQFYVDKKIIAPGAELTAPGIQAVIDSLVDKGEVKAPMKAADLIDASYLADVLK